MGSSPPPPPQPPDHSPQRADFAAQQSAQRQQQAQEFNQGVQNFNEQIAGFSGQIGDLGGRVSGLGLGDMDRIGSYQDQISDLTRQLRSTAFNEVRPNFDSVVQSPWGAVSVDVPGLARADTNARDAALLELQDLQRSLSGLQNEFRGHERDLTGFKSDIYGQLTGLGSQVGNLGIGNENMLNTTRGQFDQLRAQLAAYDNPVLGYSDQTDRWLNRINPLFEQVGAQFADIDQRREAEQGRISSFADQIYGQLGGLENLIGGLTIADDAGISDAQRQLRDIARQKAGFSSDMAFDFNRERAFGQDLNYQLQDLLADRQREQARVDEARRQAMDQAQFLNSQARMGNVYDGSFIQGLMDDINMMRDQKAGFSSLLTPDFSGSNRMLDSAEQRLSQLMDQRGQHIGRLEDQLGNIRADWEGIDPHNELAMRQALTRAMNLQNQVGRFSGQDVMGLGFDVQDKVATIDNSLQQLNMQRQQLQQQAQQLLQQYQEKQFLNKDMVTGAKDEVSQMREQAQLMNAQQALQEINRIMQHLQGEKHRLSVDAQNVANAQSMAERDLQQSIGPGGVPQFSNTPLIEGMTPEQYLALLQQQQDDQDPYSTPVNPGTFSANLGI